VKARGNAQDSRRYPKRPILGIGALVFEEGRILLIERGHDPLKGFWSLPGGALEVGETLEEGVAREVREETGLIVRPLGVVEIYQRIMRDAAGRPEYHYVLVDFICRVEGGTLAAASDVSRAEWVAPEQLSSYNITEGTLPVIEKGFREHRKYNQ
jgi:ADP-ribose pyrophosphatase YjhB (NUDIX family)